MATAEEYYKGKAPRKRKTGKHYVNNKEFYQALIEFKDKQDAANERLQIPNYIGDCIVRICNKLATRPNFASYSFREDFCDEAVLKCLEAVSKFNPEKTNNPFGYFTQIAWNVFIGVIENESQKHYTIHANLEQMMLFSDEIYSEVRGDDPSKDDGIRRHYEVLDKFEAKMARKREKQKNRGLLEND